MTQSSTAVQMFVLNAMFLGKKALLSPLELLQAIVAPFTDNAVGVYKQDQLKKVWHKAGFGGIMLAKHKDILFNSDTPPLTAFFVVLAGLLTAFVTVITAIFVLRPLMLKIAAWSFGTSLFILVFGFLILMYIDKLARAGAIGSGWIASFFSADEMPSDIPEEGRELVSRIRQAMPKAIFSIERLQVDPFLKVYLPDNSSHYFFGWNGKKKLVEKNGIIVEV